MCIAVPATIRKINGSTAAAEALGGRLNVDVRLTPTAKIGDKVLVHAGCAISVIDEKEAASIDELLAEMFT